MSEKHGLGLSFSKSQPWDKDLGASSLFGRWPRKHGESMEKGDKERRGTNQLNLLQGQLGLRPAGHLLRNCVEHTSELSPHSSWVCIHHHRSRENAPGTPANWLRARGQALKSLASFALRPHHPRPHSHQWLRMARILSRHVPERQKTPFLGTSAQGLPVGFAKPSLGCIAL